MELPVILENQTVICHVTYKDVKNLILRIKPDGSVHLSANKRVSRRKIEEFLEAQKPWLKSRLDRLHTPCSPREAVFTEETLCAYILEFCENIYGYYKARGISRPEIRFRKMSASWGNCRGKAGIITFNTNLRYAPKECVELVIWHEFTHLIVQNHSKAFYLELEKVCPNWKLRKARLKEVIIR